METDIIYKSLLNELREHDIYADGSNIMRFVVNEIFFHEEYPPQSNYVRCRAIFDKYLKNLSESELNKVYLCAKRDYSYGGDREYHCFHSIIEQCPLVHELIEKSSGGILCQFESYLSELCETSFPLHFIARDYRRTNISTIGGHNIRSIKKDIILSDVITLDPVYGVSSRIGLESGAHYIGYGPCSETKNFWCGKTKKTIAYNKFEHERKLANHDITFFQYKDYVLEVARFSEEPIREKRSITFVDVFANKQYSVPFEYVDSFVPASYSKNPIFISANDRWASAWNELQLISEDLSNNESKYAFAWEQDYLPRRLRSYLEGMKKGGLLDDRYQAHKQSTMLAIAAAISYRMNLFKYKKDIMEKPAMPTSDYINFIKLGKSSEWKPGRFLPLQPALSVVYLWSFWSKLFNIHRMDEPSKSAEKYFRIRVYDNGFSLKEKKRILSIMQCVEEDNRDIFPENKFPKIEL